MSTSDGTAATSAPRPGFARLLRDPVLLLAFGLGTGLSPKAPGTVGSMLAIALFPLLAMLSLPNYLLVVAATIVAGIWICGRAAKTLGVHDHGGIVLDEVAGLWLAMASFPPSWPWMLAGFLLFRLFDIVKPWPIRWLDRRVHGGFGIMVDDLLAGAFTWLILAAVREVIG